MTYAEVLEYIYSCLPMYQRIGGAAYKADLNNTYALMAILNHPYKHFKSIHVAGTNGKGSTSHCLASVLQEQGLKTGLYTSPHLRDFRERIRINGNMIPEERVTDFIKKHKKDFELIQPSFFEMTVGMAFQYFFEEGVDVAIIEVGMGGRLDSTNVIYPELSVITNIGLDHTLFLGNTLTKIAEEKAGIIKKGIPVVIGESVAETDLVFIEKCKQVETDLFFADQTYQVYRKNADSAISLEVDVYRKGVLYLEGLHFPLGGSYQLYNLATVFQTIELWNTSHTPIQLNTVKTGLENVVKNTGLKGRWQILSLHPLTICDTGHNKEGLEMVINQLNHIPYKLLHFVLGVVNDKDIDHILPMLPKQAVYYFCKPDIPRGLDPYILSEKAHQHQLKGVVYDSVEKAYTAAQEQASDTDLIFIGGSTFVVAEIC